MSSTLKERILLALEQAQQEGKIRTEKIREIVQNAVSQSTTEVKEGTVEIRTLAREAVAAVIDVFQERGGEIKEEITASIEGTIQGISQARRQSIAKQESEIKQLQAQLEGEEQALEQDIDSALVNIQNGVDGQPDRIKQTVNDVVSHLKDSEEIALMKKRYAQLKAQLAVVQANLAERYGTQYDDVKKYLDEAQVWYEKAKEEPEAFQGKVEHKYQEVENKLGEAGSAIAKKEQQLKQILRDLWKSINEAFRDKESTKH